MSHHIQHVLRWGFELPRRLPRRLRCSGMACLIVWCHCTYFSEECTASIFTTEEYAMPSSEVAKCVALNCNPDGRSSVLRIVGVLIRVYTASHPRRQFAYSSRPIVIVVPCISGEHCCLSFWKRGSVGLYCTLPDDPLFGHPEVNLCLLRRHSFAFRPEYSVCCLCRHQNRRRFTDSNSGSAVYLFCHSMLYKSQPSVIR